MARAQRCRIITTKLPKTDPNNGPVEPTPDPNNPVPDPCQGSDNPDLCQGTDDDDLDSGDDTGDGNPDCTLGLNSSELCPQKAIFVTKDSIEEPSSTAITVAMIVVCILLIVIIIALLALIIHRCRKEKINKLEPSADVEPTRGQPIG